MRTSQHVTPLSEHDAPDDMRAALDRKRRFDRTFKCVGEWAIV
jgi:hypothetical protein